MKPRRASFPTLALPPDIAAEVRRIAEAYPPEAIETPAWVRDKLFTPEQALAWTLRFRPQEIATRFIPAAHG